MSKKVLVWGFYNQGNIGDDLMAAIFSDILQELNYNPVIYTKNFRFNDMGYNTTQDLYEEKYDALLLGGGAFFKKGGKPDSQLEREVANLYQFLKSSKIPFFGASLGSDGISNISELSEARNNVIRLSNFLGAAVRLQKDKGIGVNDLIVLPDVVLTTSYFRSKASSNIKNNKHHTPECLINLSRRSLFYLPKALCSIKNLSKGVLLAHSGVNPTGGELQLPLLPKVKTDNIIEAIDKISEAKIVISSKLHPGIMGLSLGVDFLPLCPRPKTAQFIRESLLEGIITEDKSILVPTGKISVDNQKIIYEQYEKYIKRQLDI